MPLLLGILIITFLVLLLAIAMAVASESGENQSMLGGLESILFLVMMPKHRPRKEGDAPEEEKVLIAQMEQVLANFLHLKKRRWMQAPPTIALEIASQTGGTDISFYVCVPKSMESVFAKYVQGVYPGAVVDKIPNDYTIFEPHGYTAGAYLKQAENFLFPISTYQKLEKDPIAPITNNLSKIAPDEGAALQLIIRPVQGLNVRKIGEKALRKIRSGRHVRTAVREAGQGIVGTFFTELTTPAKNHKEGREYLDKEQGYDQAGYEDIQRKVQKQCFESNIRVVSSAQSQERAEEILSNLVDSFSQFSLSAPNSLEDVRVRGGALKRMIYDFSFRSFSQRQRTILNAEELASVYHFPTHFVETPYIKAARSLTAPPPADLPKTGVCLLGKSDYRGEEKKVYFASRQDRRRHMYVIGQTGTGKTKFLQEMVRQDIEAGEGVAVIDPHGDLIEDTLANVPRNRVDDVVLFEPFDLSRPCGLNMLEYETPEQKDFAVQEMIAIFYKLFPPEIIGPMFEHYMRNAMLALMADINNPGTLVEIPKMFTDPDFLKRRLEKVEDMVVRNFWTKEWAATTGSTRSDMLGYVVSKVGRFIENEMMRNIIGQARSGFDLADIMDNRKIFLANLSKGLTGEVNSSLLGLILISKMQMAAMRRARIKEEERRDFYLYVDEFQNFTTDSIATILSEARKYRLNLIMAHQYIPQLTDEIKNAVLGNVGTIGAFRIGAEDAEFLEKQFEPEFSRFDIVNLDNFNIIVKMMLNNKISTPFKMQTYPPKVGRAEIVDPIKKIAKLKYAKPKALVEHDILSRSFSPITATEAPE